MGRSCDRCLRGDVDANAKDRSGNTALIEAAKNGHEAVVRLLLEGGC